MMNDTVSAHWNPTVIFPKMNTGSGMQIKAACLVDIDLFLSSLRASFKARVHRGALKCCAWCRTTERPLTSGWSGVTVLLLLIWRKQAAVLQLLFSNVGQRKKKHAVRVSQNRWGWHRSVCVCVSVCDIHITSAKPAAK